MTLSFITLNQRDLTTYKESILEKIITFVKRSEENTEKYVIMVIEQVPSNFNRFTDELDSFLKEIGVHFIAIVPKSKLKNVKNLFERLEHKDYIFLITLDDEQIGDNYEGIFRCLRFIIDFYHIEHLNISIDLHTCGSFGRNEYWNYYGRILVDEKENISKALNIIRSKIENIKEIIAVFRVTKKTKLQDVRDWLDKFADIIDEKEIPFTWAAIVSDQIEKESIELMGLEKVNI
ncbi:MAG: hypothetical protein J7L07_05190 [Candidatus Odinarchaeota archaeon]|nr:hypothetical protein [Candidatus Odinarchaeota archaeon]